MGEISDISELLSAALREKRLRRLLWFALTAQLTIIATIGSTAWKMSRYASSLERANDELKAQVLMLDKKLETLTDALAGDLKDMRHEVQEARMRADSALLYAQLTSKAKP